MILAYHLLCVCAQVLSLATPWTVAHQAPPSLGFSRQEHWSGLPFPSPGDLANPGIEPRSPASQADALISEPPGKPLIVLQFSSVQSCLTLCDSMSYSTPGLPVHHHLLEFPIWNQSVVPCPVLTVASWPAYRFLKRQVRWSGIPIYRLVPNRKRSTSRLYSVTLLI